MWGMYKGRLLDIVPIAHELINENVNNGILIVDERLRMIDFNPAAAKLLSIDHYQKCGYPDPIHGKFLGKGQRPF